MIAIFIGIGILLLVVAARLDAINQRPVKRDDEGNIRIGPGLWRKDKDE